MWKKVAQGIETFFEPNFDNMRFVSHYEPPIKYKKTKKPVVFSFDIEETTILNKDIVTNKYKQELEVQFLYKSDRNTIFKVETRHSRFALDKSLVSQEELLKELTPLTSQLEITVSEKGVITATEHNAIVKKWKQLKPTLLSRYIGSQSHAYINAIEAKIQNKVLLTEDIKQVRLLGLFFGGYQAAHIKDAPKECKISNFIHCLPINIKEQITATKIEDALQEKQISISGTMVELSADNKDKIEKYFTYFNIGNAAVKLANYQRNVILDVETGYPKSVILDIELTNGKGYNRKQNFNLKAMSNE